MCSVTGPRDDLPGGAVHGLAAYAGPNALHGRFLGLIILPPQIKEDVGGNADQLESQE